MEMFIDILPIVLLILCAWGVTPVKPFSTAINTEYLSPDTGKNLRGIFALVVIFHHLAQKTTQGIVFQDFIQLGYLSVSVFFFLSGYGLQKRFLRDPGYRKEYLLKRIPAVALPYLLINMIYWLLHHFLGTTYGISDFFSAIHRGYPIAQYSWYILCILLFYICFWLLMLLCGKNEKAMLLGSVGFWIIYSLVCIHTDKGIWWYDTTPVLTLGMVWAVYEQKLMPLIRKAFPILAPICVSGFVITFLFGTTSPLKAPLRAVSAMLFMVCLLLVMLKLKIGNPVLSYLGTRSLELYLSHGLFILLFRSSLCQVNSDLLLCLLVLGCTVAFAHFLYLANRWILASYSKLLQHLTHTEE